MRLTNGDCPCSSRGYFGVGIYHTKNELNVGTLWRTADNFGAAFIFTIGRRYRQQASDTTKAQKHVPLYHFVDFEHFRASRPIDCPLIGIEQTDSSLDVATFTHPERAIYLLGAEDDGLPREIMERCHSVVHIGSRGCLNVAVAGSIVIFDRHSKMTSRKLTNGGGR